MYFVSLSRPGRRRYAEMSLFSNHGKDPRCHSLGGVGVSHFVGGFGFSLQNGFCTLQNGSSMNLAFYKMVLLCGCIDKALCSTILTSWFQKTMIMYMQSILDKMDALQNGYGFWGLVSRTCFHLIKCLCETDHFVGYSSCNSSHFISYKFCSELAANCVISLMQHKK